MRQASIVIVTYNNLQKATIPCLESIFRETGDMDFEVVVVDNCSSDGTRQYLQELACREPRLKLVLNAENRGFAGGNNDALQVAQGDIIVLLNNDTQVTNGWLARIAEALTEDMSIGMAGPVSNSAGNEQNIFISGRSQEEIIAEGVVWKQKGAGDSFTTGKLCFFCVAFRRDLLEQVGMLDERFGLGFYEDDDYCIRVQKAGYSLKCLEDVFVYHQGSASFSSVPRRTKELLKRNKRLLETKHGIAYSQAHPRDRQLDLIVSYLDRLEAHGFDEGTWFRVVQRLRLAGTLQPNGLLKRFRYNRRLRKVLERAKLFDSQREIS